MFKAVIFDIDGTLVDTVDFHAESWQKTFQHFGHQIPYEQIRPQIGKGSDQLMPFFFSLEELDESDDGLGPTFGERMREYRRELYKREYHPRVKAFPQVRELFSRIKADGKRFALASSATKADLATYKWKDIEAHKARIRQILLAGTRPHSSPDLMENFPQGQKGTTRDHLAKLVGLGSGRTYSKAAKVVTVIDEDIQNGNLASAQVLRKVLNEQSVDAAHTLLKKSPQERQAITNLIVSGEAKSTFQARQMFRQNNYAEFHDSNSATLAGFSVGDWVEVNNTTVSFTPHAGQRGQVEQILIAEQQISVNLEDGPSKVRFYPHELTLVAKAPPPCPYQVNDIVFVDIDRHEAASPQEKKWNRWWGKVTQISESGSVTVDVGKEALRLFPRDLKAIDAPSAELQDVVERVLRLRGFELDEIEQRMLDVLQWREWFTCNQLIHLENIEKLYLPTEELYEPQQISVASV